MEKIIIASGPVIIEEGKVLLNQHGDDSFWKFCGGKVENLSEDLLSAARREAKEEIGIDFELINSDPFFFYSQKKVDGEKIDIILVHWFAKRIGEVVKGADIREVAWHDINNLPENLAPNIVPVIKHFKI